MTTLARKDKKGNGAARVVFCLFPSLSPTIKAGVKQRDNTRMDGFCI